MMSYMNALDVLYYTLAVGFLILIAAVLSLVFYAWSTLKVIRMGIENLRESQFKLGLGALGSIGMLMNLFKRR
jgi:hypothetical protein